MARQTSFAGLAWSMKGKVTRRERFLAEMDAVVPWSRLIARVEPSYPKPGRGRRPFPLGTMLRIHFLQEWFGLPSAAVEEALYDSESLRRFAGLELGETPIPDESTILRFRHLLERRGLAEAMLDEVGSALARRSRRVRRGLIVEPRLIPVGEGSRSPER